MSLPVLTAPSYNLVVPSTKETIEFRPFLVKEEKLLLMAKESTDIKDIISAMTTIINNCTFNKLTVEKLSTFDLEYIFLQIRSKSVGEDVELTLVCNNKVEDEICGKEIPVYINISELKVTFPENHTNKINITKDIGCVMKYPSLYTLETLQGADEKEIESKILEIISGDIESIWNKDEVFYSNDLSTEEVVNFLNSMTGTQFQGFKDFYDTIPNISHVIKTKCPKCGIDIVHELKGIRDFFE